MHSFTLLLALTLVVGAPRTMTINKHHIIIQASFMAAPAAGPPAGYQPLANKEITPEISQVATRLLSGEMGTQTPFSIDQQQFMARVEPHYHQPPPEGSSPAEQAKYPKPWGWHHGVTVYKPKSDAPVASNYQPDRPTSGRLQLLQRLDALLDEFDS